MKKTDFAMIILIASVSVAIAFGVVSAIPGLKMSDESVKVKTVDKYTSNLDEPDPKVFNKNAINPTVDVTIGGNGASGDTQQETTDSTKKDNSNDSETQTSEPNDSQSGTDTNQSSEQ